MSPRTIIAVAGLAAALLGSGCQAPGGRPAPAGLEGQASPVYAEAAGGTRMAAGPLDPALLRPPSEPFRLGPGDLLEAEVIGVKGTRSVGPVMPDGLYYFDLLPGLAVAGHTLDEVRTRAEADLAQYYRSPQVALTLRGVRSQRVWVMGRVNTPGIYPLDTPTTVVEAVARAGGLMVSRFSGTTEELADLRHGFLVRDGAFLPVDFHRLLVDGDLGQNVYLRNGDYLYLPSALSQEVYVLGAVNQPKAVGFRDRVTLVSAVAAARDLQPTAHARRVLIIRGSLAAPEVFTADLAAVLAGAAPDVPLRPRDIVFVPEAPWTDLERLVKTVVTTFVRTIAANEGAHFAVPGAADIGVNLPLGR
jgi:protein involved in polysaccharide export with SLBB domain